MVKTVTDEEVMPTMELAVLDPRVQERGGAADRAP